MRDTRRPVGGSRSALAAQEHVVAPLASPPRVPASDDGSDTDDSMPEAERAALTAFEAQLRRADRLRGAALTDKLGAEAAALYAAGRYAEAETRAAEDAAAAEAEAEAEAEAQAAAEAAAAAAAEAEAETEARAEAEVAARYKQQAAMAEAAAQAAIVEADIVEAEAQAAAAAAAAEPIIPAERNAAAQQMMAMGFGDQALVMAALAQHGDDIAAAVAQLLR